MHVALTRSLAHILARSFSTDLHRHLHHLRPRHRHRRPHPRPRHLHLRQPLPLERYLPLPHHLPLGLSLHPDYLRPEYPTTDSERESDGN